MNDAHGLRIWGILVSTLAVGCDAQVSPGFTGETLLTITGSVQIERADNEDPLVPALAFWIPSRGEARFQEVDAQGEFPADFRLDVYEPPPTEAYFAATRQAGEPRVAIGYVAAVGDDHPSTIRTATEQNETAFGCAPEQCDKPCGGKGCLVSISEYCASDDSDEPCYSESTYCPTFTSSRDECTVEPSGDGDPSLKLSPWRAIAGFSQNYMVVFLEEAAPRGSATAHLFGAVSEVPAGYGLYKLSAPSSEQAAENLACAARADKAAASGFNEEFGTELSTLAFDEVCTTQDFGAPPADFAAPFCGGPIDEQDLQEAASEARDRYIERARVELGCSLYDAVVERVRDPANEPVAVTIGPRLQPPFALP